HGSFLHRHDRHEDYLAAMIAAVLGGQSVADWRFPELPAMPGRSCAIIILDVILGAGRHLLGLLDTLRQKQQLDLVLGLLDEVGLERLVRAATEAEEPPAAMSVATFADMAVRLAAMRVPPHTDAAASRRQAISIWLALDRRASPRAVWYGLRMLQRLLREP